MSLSESDKNQLNPFTKELLEDMESWEEGVVQNDGWLLFL